MRVPGASAKLCILLALASAPAPAAHSAERLSCPAIPAAVTYDAALDAAAACLAAGEAFAFLESNGLTVKATVEMHIVPSLPTAVTNHAFGCFSRTATRAYVLTYAVCSETAAERGGLFGEALTADLYRSLIAHEVAHVVAEQNFSVKNPNWEAHEYIAYVTQLAVLPDAMRLRILARFHPRGVATAGKINSYVLMMSPDVFAANAYLHYSRPENGATFIQELLAGTARLGAVPSRPDTAPTRAGARALHS